MGSAPVQGELWGRHAEVWAEALEPQMSPIYEATLDGLGPLTGVRLFDAGCGAGLALRLAADRGAVVSGLDASRQLLEVARRRVPGADLRTGDIEATAHQNATFDVVCAFNSIQYARDPAAAVAELARVCRPGGKVAIGVWGDAERCESEALFARLRSLAPPPPGTPAPLGCSDPGVVERLLEKAGLEVTGGGEASCPFAFQDLETAWLAHSSSGALQKVIDVAGADAVRATLTDVLEADRKGDGQIRQDNVFRYVTATKFSETARRNCPHAALESGVGSGVTPDAHAAPGAHTSPESWITQTTQGGIVGTGQVQGPLWGAAAQDWAAIAEPGQIPFYEAAFDAIDIGPGMTLLDVGCGAGLAMQLAHKRGATVAGLDAAEGLLAVARDRLPDAEVRQGDIEALPYQDDTFDTVTAFNSVQYASDPTAALRQIKRVAKSGAPVAIATWGAVEQCEMRLVLGAIGSLLPPPPPGAGGPFALAAPGALEALVESAGMTAEQIIDVATPYIYPDLDTAVHGQLASGPARLAINRAGREAAAAALSDAFETVTLRDGSIRLDNIFKVVIARA